MRRFVFILIGLHVSLTALISNYCGCSERDKDRDKCSDRDCSWSDNNQTCYSDPKVEQVYNCTQYTVTEATKQECYTKGNVCVPGAASNDGSVVCESGTINCPDITDKSICHLVSKTRQIECLWDLVVDSCKEQNYEFCQKLLIFKCVVLNYVITHMRVVDHQLALIQRMKLRALTPEWTQYFRIDFVFGKTEHMWMLRIRLI